MHPPARAAARAVIDSPILANAPNFRDIGGIRVGEQRVRSGVVYRSGVLDQLDDADLQRLVSLGLRTAIDLRSDDEVAARPNRLPPSVTTVRMPVTDVSAAPQAIMERLERGDAEGLGAEMLVRGNRAFALDYARRFGDVVRAIAAPGAAPVVVHCTAGKDRTGFAIAALLWCVGADDAAVMDDYLATNRALAARHERVLDEARNRLADVEPLMAMLQVRHEYLDAARVAWNERYGSREQFVTEGLGIDAATRARLAARLLEPAQ
jgi:protein-tyrosine phosphatase